MRKRGGAFASPYLPQQTTNSMKQIIYGMIAVLLCACNSTPTFKTNSEDYQTYLAETTVPSNSKFFDLWDAKIKSDSTQTLALGNVAREYTRIFNETGDINALKQAEASLAKAVEHAAIGRAGFLRALARNYISQHRFKEALPLAEEAKTLGGGLKATQGLLFDIHMELGEYITAKSYLHALTNPSDFGYLIRAAKWNDHLGDIDTTIRFMEKALTKAEDAKNSQLLVWCYTNIGDFYGHAGRISDAYDSYLNALALQPSNAYAKKGIAWILYAHEQDAQSAMDILNSTEQYNQSLSIDLLKSEIADFMGDTALKGKTLEAFLKKAAQPSYGAMYNTHRLEIYLNDEEFTKALELAEAEVMQRTTPETYDWLAYSHFKSGNLEKAYAIIQQEVEGQTEEPVALFHMAEIFKAKGKTKKVAEIKESLSEAAFELGPLMTEEIATL